jgi:hypothetical protein
MIVTPGTAPRAYAEQMSFQAAFMLIIADATTNESAREHLIEEAKKLALLAKGAKLAPADLEPPGHRVATGMVSPRSF